MNEIEKFLIDAKRKTYANANGKRASSTRRGSKDYEYTNGNMTYHDTYFGGTKFIGEEVVYENSETPIWGMNYYGVTVVDTLSEEAIDKALRPALMMVGSDNIVPVRGPREFINGEYKYTFEVEGDLKEFKGTETIYKNDEKVYVLECHGGMIK